MSLEQIHLRKLLKIIYSEGALRRSFLRSDIREDIAREGGQPGGGGDFYGPFWKDAKEHVYGNSDLHETTDERIRANYRRGNLYPRLRDGFLLWWTERRRWTNAPFEPIDAPKRYFAVPGQNVTVKIGGVLAVRDGHDDDHFVYPYWFDRPILSEEAARLGLWLLNQALPHISPDELRILDVLRGQTFALNRTPLVGDEARVFARRYATAIAEWHELRREYD